MGLLGKPVRCAYGILDESKTAIEEGSHLKKENRGAKLGHRLVRESEMAIR